MPRGSGSWKPRAPYLRAAIAGLIALTLAAGSAWAEPGEAERAKARLLMDQGDALVAQHQLQAALAKYRAADAIMGVTSTGIEVARTLAKLGQLREARRVAQTVAAIPKQADEPEPFTRARDDAVALERDLDARIPELSVHVAGLAAGNTASVTIDGSAVASDASPHALDPGAHDVSATAGGSSASEHVVLKEGERRSVTLKLTPRSPSATPVATRPTADRGAATRPSEHGTTLGYVIGGVGLGALAVAGVTSVVIWSNYNSIKDDCPDKHCSQDTYDRISGQKSPLVVNAVAWGVGIVGTGLGAYLVLSSDGKEQTAIGPSWSPAGPSVALRRTW